MLRVRIGILGYWSSIGAWWEVSLLHFLELALCEFVFHLSPLRWWLLISLAPVFILWYRLRHIVFVFIASLISLAELNNFSRLMSLFCRKMRLIFQSSLNLYRLLVVLWLHCQRPLLKFDYRDLWIALYSKLRGFRDSLIILRTFRCLSRLLLVAVLINYRADSLVPCLRKLLISSKAKIGTMVSPLIGHHRLSLLFESFNLAREEHLVFSFEP